MPIERKRVARHILVTDTNILWHDDKSICVSPKFQDFWDRNANDYVIDLFLPEVVRGELLFQHTTSARKTLKRANEEFERLSAVTAYNYTHRVTEKKISSDVEKKLNSWMLLSGCQVFDTPVNSIDWQRLISDAIWREKPFVEDKNSEKGFRDALIVETTVAIADAYSNVNLAFISSDKLVLDAAKSRLDQRCNCYETIEEFETYLKLTDEKLTSDFVKAIQVRARQKFHDENDTSCLLYREKLTRNIREIYEIDLLPPVTGVANSLLHGLQTPKNRWVPASDDGVWIRAPEFLKLENDNEFYWRSKIIFVQLFKYEGNQTGGLLSETTLPGDSKLRKVEFPVIWKSKVAKNGRFLSTEFLEFDESETIFEPITDEESEHYGIEADVRD